MKNQTVQAAKQLSVSGKDNLYSPVFTRTVDQAPPVSLSRPFAPAEFLAWLSWHESHGDLTLSEIRAEALSMLSHLGLIDGPTLVS